MGLAGIRRIDWQGWARSFALASRVKRRGLIDHARAARAEDRPGIHRQVELKSDIATLNEGSSGLLSFDGFSAKVAKWGPGKSQVVEVRFVAGHPFEVMKPLDSSS
jgi:ECF sigma factor